MTRLKVQQTYADGRFRKQDLHSGRSRTCRVGRHQEPVERLQFEGANWRSRPSPESAAANLSLQSCRLTGAPRKPLGCSWRSSDDATLARQPLHEIQRVHHPVRGAVAPGDLSLSTICPAAFHCTRSLAADPKRWVSVAAALSASSASSPAASARNCASTRRTRLEHGRSQQGPRGQQQAPRERQRQNPLAHRHMLTWWRRPGRQCGPGCQLGSAPPPPQRGALPCPVRMSQWPRPMLAIKPTDRPATTPTPTPR